MEISGKPRGQTYLPLAELNISMLVIYIPQLP
jgi:hypothetical protein